MPTIQASVSRDVYDELLREFLTIKAQNRETLLLSREISVKAARITANTSALVTNVLEQCKTLEAFAGSLDEEGQKIVLTCIKTMREGKKT